MSDLPLKPLHFACSLEELKFKSEVKIPSNLPLHQYCQQLKNINKYAADARKKKDQELEFLYLHRYLALVGKATKNSNFSRKSLEKEFEIAKLNVEKYSELTDVLKKRYEEKVKKSNTVMSCITVYKADPNKGNLNGVTDTVEGLESKLRDKAEEKIPKRPQINCFELHSLVTANPPKQTFLIMDVRSSVDFEKSHINHRNVLNVSTEKLQLGMSANTLGKKFIDNESETLWKTRGTVDKLILLDYNSSLDTLDTKSPLHHLKNIITKWDQGVEYKCPPLILEGGYEEVLNRFPQMTTLSKVNKPYSSKSNVIPTDTTLLSFDYPMEELEMEPDKESIIPKKVPSAPVVVDRSSKPQQLPEVEKTYSSVKDDSTTLYHDFDSDSSTNGEESTQIDKSINTKNRIGKRYGLPHNEENLMKKVQVESMRKSKKTDVISENTDSKEKSFSRDGSPVSSIKSNQDLPPNESPPPSGKDSSQKQLKELRKLKPQLGGKSQEALIDSFSNRDDISDLEEGIFTSPLKKDGGSGGLKRSSSSPNIAQLKDDDSFHMKQPTFTRANKPISNIQPSFISAYGERTDSTYGTTTAGLTGLKNFANNCYMNSIIQCLNNTESLVKEMTALNKPALNVHSRTKGRVAHEVIDAFRNMWAGNIRVYNIRGLKGVMGTIKEIFKGNAHQDSNEFLIILLEHLHEDLNKPAEVTVLDGAVVESGERAWGEFRRKNCSVIQRLFYGQHKSSVTCITCKHTSATFEQFFNLFVPIPSGQSVVKLIDCIQLYMSGERISGWKCPKCKTERNATKKFDISKLPPILVIALKRFTQEEDSWLQKKEDVVSYPLEDLDMSRFTVADSEQRHTKYNLYAMSIHSGTLKSGHYRAICKNHITQKWYLFDDQIVEPLPLQSVKNNPEVYILFYNAVTS